MLLFPWDVLSHVFLFVRDSDPLQLLNKKNAPIGALVFLYLFTNQKDIYLLIEELLVESGDHHQYHHRYQQPPQTKGYRGQ